MTTNDLEFKMKLPVIFRQMWNSQYLECQWIRRVFKLILAMNSWLRECQPITERPQRYQFEIPSKDHQDVVDAFYQVLRLVSKVTLRSFKVLRSVIAVRSMIAQKSAQIQIFGFRMIEDNRFLVGFWGFSNWGLNRFSAIFSDFDVRKLECYTSWQYP